RVEEQVEVGEVIRVPTRRRPGHEGRAGRDPRRIDIREPARERKQMRGRRFHSAATVTAATDCRYSDVTGASDQRAPDGKGVPMRGKLLWFNENKKFGFIRTDEGERLYVHLTGFAVGHVPSGPCAGTVVDFERL